MTRDEIIYHRRVRVLAVRRTCVPGSVDFSQSQNPVSAVNTETAAPPRSVNDPAR